MIGKSAYRWATSSSDCDFSRCCHSGVRRPGYARGMRSARPAFSRNRAPNSALDASSPTTASSTSSGSSITSSAPGGSSASGRWTMMPSSDQIASDSRPKTSRIRRLSASAHARGTPRPRPDPPAGGPPPAVRAQDAQPPVADLVAEALDDDRAVGRHDARRGLLFGEEVEEVLRRERIEVVVALQRPKALVDRPAAEGADLAAELLRPADAVALPERHGARRARSGRDRHPVAADVLDPPGRGAEQERLPRPRLVDHLLAELADAAAVGEDDGEQAAVGDRARVRHGELARALARPD